jgi:alpha-methylacyl-CoA racemase
LAEAPNHPHNKARHSFVQVGDALQPSPTPRFSRTVADTPHPVAPPGTHTRSGLQDYGFSASDIDNLIAAGVVAQVYAISTKIKRRIMRRFICMAG